MEYLTKYNLTTEEINDIINTIDEEDKLELELNVERVSSIIDYIL